MTEALRQAHIALTAIFTHPTLELSDFMRDKLTAAIAAAEAELSQPVRVGLTECNDNDSPWLICKTCAAAGRCAKTAPQKAMTADQIERHIGADEGDREAVEATVREVEAWHGIERARNIPAAQEGK
jgi:hypothetical protein